MAVPDKFSVIHRDQPEITEQQTLFGTRDAPDPDFYRHCALCEEPVGWLEGAPYEGPDWIEFIEVERLQYTHPRRYQTMSVCMDDAGAFAQMGTTLALHLDVQATYDSTGKSHAGDAGQKAS